MAVRTRQRQPPTTLSPFQAPTPTPNSPKHISKSVPGVAERIVSPPRPKAFCRPAFSKAPSNHRRPEPVAFCRPAFFQGTVVAQPFPRPVDSSQAGAWGLLQASLFQGTVVAQPFPRPVDSSQAGAWGQPFFKALLSHSLFQGPLTLRRPEPGASLFSRHCCRTAFSKAR